MDCWNALGGVPGTLRPRWVYLLPHNLLPFQGDAHFVTHCVTTSICICSLQNRKMKTAQRKARRTEKKAQEESEENMIPFDAPFHICMYCSRIFICSHLPCLLCVGVVSSHPFEVFLRIYSVKYPVLMQDTVSNKAWICRVPFWKCGSIDETAGQPVQIPLLKHRLGSVDHSR